MLKNGQEKIKSTEDMLLTALISFANVEETSSEIRKLYATDLKAYEGIALSTEHSHSITKKIFSSKAFTDEEKDSIMAKLSTIDASDKLALTKAFCSAAKPDFKSKKMTWSKLFDSEGDLGLYECWAMCEGFMQFSQRDLLTQFEDSFFF